MGLLDWFSPGKLIGSGIGAAVGSIATPFLKVWADHKKSLTDERIVSTRAATEMTLEGYRADVQHASLQRALAEADRTHWSTRWIRPAFCGLAFAWMANEVYKSIASGAPLDEVVKYLLAGIVASIFLLRPWEKNRRADIIAAAAGPRARGAP